LSSGRICRPAAEAGLTASWPNDATIFHAARAVPEPARRRRAFARAWLRREGERATDPASWAADRPAVFPKH
jgi:hypothetical protein